MIPEKEGAKYEKSMLELFKTEIENRVKELSEFLLTYHLSKENLKLLEPLMRAAHSIKGAAKVLSFGSIISLSHSMEDCFIAAQEGKIVLNDSQVELFFKALDAIAGLVEVPLEKIPLKVSEEESHLNKLAEEIRKISAGQSKMAPKKAHVDLETKLRKLGSEIKITQEEPIIRLTAKSINHLMGLAAESMVEARWLKPFCDTLNRLKASHSHIYRQLELLKKKLEDHFENEDLRHAFLTLREMLHQYHTEFSDRISDLELFISHHSNLVDRLHNEIIESRMRPFSDAIDTFPRMVWETARHLHKQVRLEIFGKSTLIDRDILEKLEVPISHLLRNAVDHGIGTPEERIAVGKSPEGVIRLEAFHKAGKLAITVSDDGKGIDLTKLKEKILSRKWATNEQVEKFSEEELLEFMFAPGFSTSEKVTEFSGRGIGLDILRNMLRELSGSVHIENRPGKGISFFLQLPLTLSVLRALIIKVGKGIFALPLARIEQALVISKNQIEKIEGREYFTYQGKNVGLISAKDVFYESTVQEQSFRDNSETPLFVVILRDNENYYGIVVDQLLGEKELVLQNIGARLGNIPYISSGSVLETGEPVLIVATEEFIQAIDQFLNSGFI